MTKAEQRKQALAARRALSPEERRACSAAICERLRSLPGFREAGTILSYRALADEVDLRPLEGTVEARLVYPRCLPGGELEARQPIGPWKPGPFGIEEPDPERSLPVAPEALDLVLVPCVGFDSGGRRLGHGAGYYDRYLPHCPRAKTILVAFEAQRLARVVTDEHDRNMDWIVTENGIYKP